MLRSWIKNNPLVTMLVLGCLALVVMSFTLFTSLKEVGDHELRPVNIGADKCAHCGMIISDLRYAVAAVSIDPKQDKSFVAFDDIGCFLDYATEHSSLKWDGWMHDYRTTDQLPFSVAVLEKGSYHTPMGSGWIARSPNGKGGRSLSEILSEYQ